MESKILQKDKYINEYITGDFVLLYYVYCASLLAQFQCNQFKL